MAVSPRVPKKKPTWEQLIDPSPKQREFLSAVEHHDFVLYGGAAGGGKSYILRWWLALYLYRLYRERGLRNVQVGLFCEDYPSLYDRQISKIKFEFPPEIGTLKEGVVKNFQLRPELGGGIIALRNLDDPSKYLSAEFAAIGVDELTKNPKDTFDFLRMRLRWPGVDRPKFVGASNPGGKGHAWVKKIWIEKEFPEELQHIRQQFAFIQAKASHNPHLSPAYYQSLLTLPHAMAQAYAEGSWDTFAGQYFDIFGSQNTVRAEAIGIQPWWPKWISIDWGFKHDSAVYWHTTDPKGVTFTYRELVQNRLSPRMLAQAILDKIPRDSRGQYTETYERIYLSPDAFAERTSENTYAQQLDEILMAALKLNCLRADDDRVGGWMLMYSMLQARQWCVADACPRLIANLPTLIRDPKKVEDILKSDGDDPGDSARYGLKSHLAAKDKPYEYRLTEALDAVPDHTAKHMLHLKMEDEQQKQRELVQQMFSHGHRRRFRN